MDLSNREISASIWMMIIIAAISINPSTRPAVINLLRTVFQLRIILVTWVLTAAYVMICVIPLKALHIWTWVNLKVTILWALTFAFVSLFDITKIEEDRDYFHKFMKDIVNFTVIFLFITDLKSFSLVAELILLPTVTFISLLYIVAERKTEDLRVRRFLKGLMAVIGLYYFGHSLYYISMDPSKEITPENFREFVIPIILSVMFLPFLYMLCIYAVYERTFSTLGFGIKDVSLRRYAMVKTALSFGPNIDLLKRWRRRVNLAPPKEKETIMRYIFEVKALRNREKTPPLVAIEDGWSPYAAMQFLAASGIIMEDYHLQFDSEWISSSKAFKIEKNAFSPTINYCVIGTIVIGGNIVSRGMTFDNLLAMYFTRDVKHTGAHWSGPLFFGLRKQANGQRG